MHTENSHPQVTTRTDRAGSPWIFRYWVREPDGDDTLKRVRKYVELGPSEGRHALTREEAERARDRIVSEQRKREHVDPIAAEAKRVVAAAITSTHVTAAPVLPAGTFGEAACLYRDGYLRRDKHIAKPTREKEAFYIREYIIPRWGTLLLNDIQQRTIEDWLHTTFDSWWTMHGVRAIMNRIYQHAQAYGLWPEGRSNPASKARLGRKRHKRERRILSFEETARVLARLEQPVRLVIQTCIATGARISEVLGLKWKHVDLLHATVRIEQRVWHQEVGRLKTEYSRRVLGIGDLATQFASKALMGGSEPEAFVFQQRRGPGRPMWDSSVRDALHSAARDEGCDFSGLGPHSFRRANITWRQEVGGSAIEASKIAGHNGLNITSEYTFVSAERQNELTRRIQQKLAIASEDTKQPGT